MAADFTFDFGSVSATEAEAVAETEAGKAKFSQMFGDGAVSVKLRKSEAGRLERFLSGEGFAVNCWYPEDRNHRAAV